MRRAIASFIWLAALAAAAPVLADAASQARYTQMVAAAKSGGGVVNWTALRQAYAASDNFDALGQKTGNARKAMFTALNASDFKTAAAQANFILALDYVDIDAHVVLDIAAAQAGDKAGAQREHDAVVGILQSIRTGDGLTPEHAFTPISIGEEYAMLRAFSLNPTHQALVRANGHSYDRLDVTTQDGKTLTLYFLVDAILAKEAPAPGAPPPVQTIQPPAKR